MILPNDLTVFLVGGSAKPRKLFSERLWSSTIMALMEQMRGYTKVFLFILVFSFVGTIIFDWGMNYLGLSQKAGVIATVNGKDISLDAFNRAYQGELDNYRQRTGSEVEESQLEYIRDQVYESLIRETLVEQEIQRRGIHASDDEIVHYIYNDPPAVLKQNKGFQNDQGQFDFARYQQALNDPNVNWRPAEDYLRNTLPFQKFQEELTLGAMVTDDEVRQEYERRTLKAKVRYLFIDPAHFRSTPVTVSSDEVKTYYNDHLNEYKDPEKRAVNYLIYPTKATAADSQAVQRLAVELAQRARNGEDFAELAKTYSEDPGSRERGGDVGFFKRTDMVKPFADAAFAAKPGDVVGPVTSTYGLHVIKVVAHKNEKNEESVQASHILLKYQSSPQTMEAMKDSANFLAAVAKESSWEEALKNEKIPALMSTPFTEGSGFIPGIGVNRQASRFAFKNQAGAVSDAFETPQGFLVVRVASILPERIKELSEVQADIENTLKQEKQKDLGGELAQKLRKEIEQGTTLEAIAARDSLQLRDPEPFQRSGYISGIGRDADFIGAAFALKPQQLSPPVKGVRGYYLIQMVSQDTLDPKDYAAKKDGIRTQLLERAQQNAFTEWYTAVKEQAEIKDYRDLYFN